MSDLEFSIKLESDVKNLMQAIINFENWPNYLPAQLKSVKIIEKRENEITTEEILVFKTIIKNEIKQTTIHKIVSDHSIQSKVISGHAKGTVSNILLNEIESGTDVIIKIQLKLSLKSKFLSPIIKKVYKRMLHGVLLKIDFSLLDKEVKS